MEDIIEPIDKDLLLSELTDDKFVRTTNYGGNKIYIVNAHNAPNTMREIGRLRELAFRHAGGGTGKSCDIDECDTRETPYQQLIVWSEDMGEILGGYRFIDCSLPIINAEGEPELSTAEIFNFSEKFINEYLPHTIELGRSFVQPKFQSRQYFKQAIYALDNLWDGLGAIYMLNRDHIKYFFGKVTMYTSFNQTARDYILSFMKLYFKDPERLVIPKGEIIPALTQEQISEAFPNGTYRDDFKCLNRIVRDLGENIPPMFNAYMNLSSTMKLFGTAPNPFFGGVEETGILITVDDVYQDKKARHIDTFTYKK
ncbi:MAG: GNAT family N-acetyltransferase [Bacteroidales bacterium]|nr:GNAT family N-acetyltransferase [Bacteroidales bacterium]